MQSHVPAEKYQFVHHFIPHPVHKRRATLLSMQAIWIYSALILSVFLFVKAVPKVLPGVLGYATSISTLELLEQTNALRAKNGLPALKMNTQLSEAANKKAAHMFQEGYWAHISPDGVKPWEFILGEQYDYAYAGENLAKNFNTSEQVISAWFNSETHRENLLSSNYEDIGFAVVNGVMDGYETTLVVQMFGKTRFPQVAAVSPSSELGIQNSNVSLTPEVQEQQNTELVIQQPNSAELVVSSIPLINVTDISRTLLLSFGVFIITLLSLDIWYSHKKGIPKVTGHTVAHIMFLTILIVSVWFVLSPGRIL